MTKRLMPESPFIDIFNATENHFALRVLEHGIYPEKRLEYMVEYFEFLLLFFY